jgi:hypothetical protein
MKENIDRHALAGFRCVDAVTKTSITAPLAVNAQPLTVHRNRSGVFAVMDAPGISRSQTQPLIPDPAVWPKPTSYEITIQDPSQQFLPRKADIQVPQPLPAPVTRGTTLAPPPTTTPQLTTTTPPVSTTAPGTTTPPVSTTPQPTTTVPPVSTTPQPTTTLPSTTTTMQGASPQPPPLTTPQTVVLYPSPAGAVPQNWAVVRASVANNATPPQPLPGVVVQVLGATGVTNSLGEALLAVPGPGLQPSSNSTGPVFETNATATVTAWCDKSLLKKPPGWISNPDDILTTLSTGPWQIASQPGVLLAPGQTTFVVLTIPM